MSISDCGFPVLNIWFSVFVKNTNAFSDVVFDGNVYNGVICD